MKKHTGLLLALALIFVFTGSFSASAAPLSIRLAFDSPSAPGNTYNELAKQYKKEVEEASKGSIIIEVFSDGQLGSERENFEAVQMGTLDMSVISNASIGAFSPFTIAIDLPFMFPGRDAAHAALDGPAGQAIVKAVEASTGVKSLAFGEAGFRHMITNKTGIRKVEDMAGLKIRTMENEMYVSTYKLIGANSVPMAWGEVLSGLQQGTIDGLDGPIMLIISAKLHDLTKYLSLTGHFYNALQLIVNGSFYAKLTPEQQEILASCAKKAAASQRAILVENEGAWIEDLKAKGMEVIPASEISLSALGDRVEEIYTTYAKQIGGTYVQDLREAAKAAARP